MVERTLDSHFARLTPEEQVGITVIAMDLWDPYLNAVRGWVLEADRNVVFDEF